MRAHNFKDLTGQRFGKRVVIKFIETRVNGSGEKYGVWLTRCDCGKEKEASTGTVRHGFSCGCYCREVSGISRRLPKGRAARNVNLSSYMSSAKKRNLEWSIPDGQFDFLTSSNCYYCGTEPKQICKASRSCRQTSQITYNGIDRVDNSIGYNPENTVPCCKVCNRAKDVRSREEFIAWAERVVNHHRKRAWDSSKPFLTTETNL
jgi:hypothetical protein